MYSSIPSTPPSPLTPIVDAVATTPADTTTAIESLTIEDTTSTEPSLPDPILTPTTAASDPLLSSAITTFSTPDSLCIEIDSLHDLASRGQWRSVIDKVARARSLSLLTQPHQHLVYLAFNLLSLFKLRRFPDAAQELRVLSTGDEKIGLDSPRFRYEAYPEIYPGKSGSMLPFSVRYVYAELPQRLGDRKETLDRLYKLVEFTKGKTGPQWVRREKFVISAICCNHFCEKEYDVCLLLIQELIKKDPNDPMIRSKMGYVQMQMGDLEGSKATFEHVEAMRSEVNSNNLKFENLVRRNTALGYILEKDYPSAVRKYEECIETDPRDMVAINNKALCLMYSRDLSDSIKVLEGALERVPTATLNEMVVVNLCSMYELAYVNNGEIKKSLNTWIARVAPDDFDSSCTRI